MYKIHLRRIIGFVGYRKELLPGVNKQGETNMRVEGRSSPQEPNKPSEEVLTCKNHVGAVEKFAPNMKIEGSHSQEIGTGHPDTAANFALFQRNLPVI